MPAKINLLNQKIGKLKVIKETQLRKNKSVVWACQCECGNIEFFSTKELRSDGIIQCHNCGNNRKPKTQLKEDIIGKKFNYLLVLEKTDKQSGGKYLYKCLCQCGKITYVTSGDLKSGGIKSCGCIRFKYKVGDIINNRKIISLNRESSKNKKELHRHYYKCKCLFCGREYEALGSNLQNSVSCGCQKSIGEKNIRQILTANEINFIQQYAFPQSYYRFDFAILDKNNNIIKLIEFDGQQHYLNNVKESGWNNLQHYQKTHKRDLEKNKLAFKYDIPLIRIPYWERYNMTLDLLLNNCKYEVKKQ